MTEKSKLDSLLASINKKYADDSGRPVVLRASTASSLDVPRIETRILALDYVTGGGIPRGRVTMLWGDESSGKSLSALLVVRAAQHKCRNCHVRLARYVNPEWTEWVSAWKEWLKAHEDSVPAEYSEYNPAPDFLAEGHERPVHYFYKHAGATDCTHPEPYMTLWQDAEGTFEVVWAEGVGVDTEHVLVIKTEFAEQAIDISDSLLREGGCQLQVIDSVAHLTPMKEITESVEKAEPGLQARLVNRACRKWVSSLNVSDEKPTIILIQHIYHQVGVMFGSPDTMRGGRNQMYATSLRLKFLKPKYEKVKIATEDVVESVEIRFGCDKNKVSPPRREGSFKMHLRDSDDGKFHKGDTDELDEVFRRADALGLITARDGEKGWKLLTEEAGGKPQLKVKFTDPEKFEQLRDYVLKTMLRVL